MQAESEHVDSVVVEPSRVDESHDSESCDDMVSLDRCDTSTRKARKEGEIGEVCMRRARTTLEGDLSGGLPGLKGALPPFSSAAPLGK
eukprot:11920372-Alexandrium_andersonii.AAC.1